MANRADDSFVAIDLGAGSGRLVIGSFGQERLTTREVHRFKHPIPERLEDRSIQNPYFRIVFNHQHRFASCRGPGGFNHVLRLRRHVVDHGQVDPERGAIAGLTVYRYVAIVLLDDAVDH